MDRLHQQVLDYVRDPGGSVYGDTSVGAQISRHTPVLHVDHLWFISSNAACRQVLESRSLAMPRRDCPAPREVGTEGSVDTFIDEFMPVRDAEDHRRLRGHLTPLLSHRRLDDFQGVLCTIADDVVTRLLDESSADLVDESKRLAGFATAASLGVDPSDWELLLRWADTTNARIAETLTASLDVPRETWGCPVRPPDAGERAHLDDVIRTAVPLLAEPRRRKVGAGVDRPGRHAGGVLTHEEPWQLAQMTFMGGLDTVVATVCNAVYLLDRYPHVLDGLRRGDVSAEDVVDETVRLMPPFLFVTRDVQTAPGDVDLDLAAGDQVFLLLGAADLDERVFPDPESFEPGRDQRHNLAFGRGAHHCVGQGLARRVVTAFIDRYAARVRSTIIERPVASRRSSSFGGPRSMRVRVA